MRVRRLVQLNRDPTGRFDPGLGRVAAPASAYPLVEPVIDVNAVTLASYDARLDAYAAGTPDRVSGELGAWLDLAVDGLRPAARIREIGSGLGRDAAHLEAAGFRVCRSDASVAFTAHLRAQGFEVDLIDVLHDDLTAGWDLVVANAVLLHLTVPQCRVAVSRIHASLAGGGRFAFTLKTGNGSGWSSEKLGLPRFFTYWREPSIRAVLADAGFTAVEQSAGPGSGWLHLIARA